MSELNIYILILIVVVIFVNSSFSFLKSSSVSFDQNLLIIEKLTTYSTKPKNYRNTPKGYATFGCMVQGSMNNELATFEYKFPFIDNRNVTFKSEIHAKNMSSTVSGFGAHNSYFATVNDYGRLQSTDHSFLLQNMNKDGFFYRSPKSYDYGVNYNEIIAQSKDLTLEIARFIKNELSDNYTYENCIAAALNFVQYIPYGQPEFDAGEYTYFGVSIPHESFVISYCDCDSKSVLLCGILQHLLEFPEDNLIMVYCTMEKEHHMIVGVHGLNYPGQRHIHNGREYLLLETTVPISLHEQRNNKFDNIHVYNLEMV